MNSFPSSDTELIFVTLELPTGSNLEQTEQRSLAVAQEYST